MLTNPNSRRGFLKTTLAAATAPTFKPFYILKAQPKAVSGEVVGHGSHKYRVHMGWGNLDAAQFPVKNCHEMVQDSKGRLLMLGDDVKNNVLVYDRSGKLLDSWGHEYPGGHGLTLWNANGEEFLFICDPELGKVVKTDMKGNVLMTIGHPSNVGAYKPEKKFKPTETAIGPDGSIYVADGYGSDWILHYTANGEFIRKFGGMGDGDSQLSTAHGVAVDYRDNRATDRTNPTLLVTSRNHNSFKRFTLDGNYLSTIFLPGAYVCRPVIKGETLYAGVCYARQKYLNLTHRSGFVTILDNNDKVISNPGGTRPIYHRGELQLMTQEYHQLTHCHDVCIDNDENIYVCQWNADKTYPIKLERV
jgi:hypothetical protein